MSRLEELTHKRFHGTVVLNPARVGHDASKVAEEVISHRHGIVGSQVRVTLEIEAEVPAGVPEQVVRIVAENSRALRLRARGLRWNRNNTPAGASPAATQARRSAPSWCSSVA
jgi:hypothetical protein